MITGLNCLGRSFIWLALNSVFGIGPAYALILLKKVLPVSSSYYPKLKGSLIIEKITHEGIILFYCCAIMAAVAIDYSLSKFDFKKNMSALIWVVVVVSYVFVCGVFSVLFFNQTVLDNKSIFYFHYVLIIVSLGFSWAVKWALFYKEKTI